jgi:hypothetical protein
MSGNAAVKKTLYYFSLIMVLVYIALGSAIAFSTFLIDMIPTNRTIIGGVFVVYGIFRFYILNRQRKSYKLLQTQKGENNHETAK